ncbi:transmembrane protein [Paenibacillus algicola]|uniref:Transmembrane protein n=2 Tax=Paenibacillus algicola TaxID=2565926 RepID=A0A4P8XNR4_9BACL|nr:transmembrane protein [Paenibacillus algicola]
MDKILGLSRTSASIREVLRNLILVAAVFILCLLIGISGSIESLHMRLLEGTILLTSLLIAFQIHFKKPQAFMSYALLIWAISPEMRRILDWSFHSYTETSIISLIPYTVSLIMLIPVIQNIKRMDSRIGLMLKIVGAALLYGFGIGFLKYGLSSVFDLLNYVVPFLVVAYVHVSNFGRKVHDRWLRSFSIVAVVIAVYGIYQYMLLPPWDHFWMISSEMNSIGPAEPQRFRVFSLLNSPGPTGLFLGLALAIMTVHKKCRAFGYFGILTVAFALLLTLVRVGWIACVLMILAYFFQSQLKSKIQLLFIGIVLVLAYQFIFPVLPGSSQVISRIDTFSALEEDHSFKERLTFASHIFSSILSNPLGMGLGSSGLGAKLTQSEDVMVVFDNGYLNLFYTFGLVFGLAIFTIFVYILISLYKLSKSEKMYASLSFAAICAILFLLLASNVLRGLSGFILLLIISLAYAPNSLIREEV